jgi:hypothetical protein
VAPPAQPSAPKPGHGPGKADKPAKHDNHGDGGGGD